MLAKAYGSNPSSLGPTLSSCNVKFASDSRVILQATLVEDASNLCEPFLSSPIHDPPAPIEPVMSSPRFWDRNNELHTEHGRYPRTGNARRAVAKKRKLESLS